jgi:DNA-binding transcriptional ArsR family regulator
MYTTPSINGWWSPTELSRALEEPLGNISYHVQVLKDAGLVDLVGASPSGGSIRHHYEVRIEESFILQMLGLSADAKRAPALPDAGSRS